MNYAIMASSAQEAALAAYARFYDSSGKFLKYVHWEDEKQTLHTPLGEYLVVGENHLVGGKAKSLELEEETAQPLFPLDEESENLYDSFEYFPDKDGEFLDTSLLVE